MFASALVLEDCSQTRALFVRLLSELSPGCDVQQSHSVRRALDLCRKTAFDCAIIDLSLPDGTGYEVLQYLCAHCPDTVPIVATVMGSDAAIVSALSAGAQGYILKSDPEALIKTHLQRIPEGVPPLSPAIARRVMQHFQTTGPSAGDPPPLTERETDVLRLIAKGLRVPEAAQALSIAPSTVTSHVKAIYRKLNINSRAEASYAAARIGLMGPD